MPRTVSAGKWVGHLQKLCFSNGQIMLSKWAKGDDILDCEQTGSKLLLAGEVHPLAPREEYSLGPAARHSSLAGILQMRAGCFATGVWAEFSGEPGQNFWGNSGRIFGGRGIIATPKKEKVSDPCRGLVRGGHPGKVSSRGD